MKSLFLIFLITITSYSQESEITDNRDGEVYKTVTIETQTWLAENIRYKVPLSLCMDNKKDNCKKYGRLYSWNEAMNLNEKANWNTATVSNQSSYQGICPSGWRLPSIRDIKILLSQIDINSKTIFRDSIDFAMEYSIKQTLIKKVITGLVSVADKGENKTGLNLMLSGENTQKDPTVFDGFGEWVNIWLTNQSEGSWMSGKLSDMNSLAFGVSHRTFGVKDYQKTNRIAVRCVKTN